MCQQIMDTLSRFIYDLCMMPVTVKEADLDRIDVPEEYEVFNATEDHDVVQSTLL
jgi:hypothetical protein